MYTLLFLLFTSSPYLEFKDLGVKMPPIGDNLLSFILNNDNTVYYKLPKVYQSNDPNGLTGVFAAEYLPEINANLDFPWDRPFGFNQVPKDILETFNFFLLPRNKKIAVFNEQPVKWLYPDAGIFGEILIIKEKEKNQKYICEIRIRIKRVFNGNADWESKIFRQIANRMELESFLGVPTYYSSAVKPATKYVKLENPEKDKVFIAQAYLDVLPDIPADKLETIFSTFPFKDVTSEPWSETCIAPTSTQEFNLFPKDYALLIKMDSFSCQRCHKQTFVPNNRLLPNEPIIKNNPDKIGRIRGYDGIFTWQPFDESCISKDGTNQGFKLRSYDFEKGYVEYYDPIKHKDYVLTGFFQKELIQEEIPVALRTKPVHLNVVDNASDYLGIKTSIANPEFVKYYKKAWNGGLYIDEVKPNGIFYNVGIKNGNVLAGIALGNKSYATLKPKDLEDILKLPDFNKVAEVGVWIISPEGIVEKKVFNKQGVLK
jgi:hypothetical protein